MSLKVEVLNSASNVEDLIERSVGNLGGLDISTCNRIVIIPNIASSNKSEQSASIARIDIIEALIKLIKNKNKNVEIIIFCGASNSTSVFNDLGYTDIAIKYSGLKLLDLNLCSKVKILLPQSKILGAIDIPQELVMADAVISVATLRRHIHERLAGIWETPFCIITNSSLRLKIQANMSKALYDLNYLAWPSLCVIDAEYALEGTGPIEGRPKYLGKLIIGTNPIATDIAAARIVAEKPKSIPSLKYAMKKLKIKEDSVHITGDYSPVKLAFISGAQYRLLRTGLFFRRLSTRIENFGNLLLYLSLALVSVGAKDLATGRWVSLKDSMYFARVTYSKVYEMETLLDRKIVINKHVKEQSVS
jgi:uncharacterized protein (DUF362 family)